MATPTVESLEARFAELQRKILGDSLTIDAYERNNDKSNQPIADLLVDSSSLMCAALSGREKINTIVPRMGDLDRYLDPTFEDALDMSALVEVLISMEPSFHRQCEQLDQLGKLSPVLDSKEINNVASHKERIERLLLSNLEKHNLSEECCSRVYQLVEDYNAIVVNITKTLVQWDDMVTQVELERKPKKVIE